MGDYTPMQVIIYDCPPHRVNAVLDILDDHGLDENWSSRGYAENKRLSLGTTYGESEARGDESEEVAARLIEAAPEATFVAWTDPKYEWLGSLVAYAPDLGEFASDCDAEGQPQFTAQGMARLLGRHRDKSVSSFLEDVLPRATGELWFTRFGALMERNMDVVIDRAPEAED